MQSSAEIPQVTVFLRETCALAGDELDRRQGTGLKVMVKADTSLVTEADLASEKIIMDRIRKAYPDDVIFSEEAGRSSAARPPGGAVWIIDPLDGTTNYANGYPFYCISIGRGRFDQAGKITMEAGAVYDPTRKRLYHAAAGHGAWLEAPGAKPRRLQVAAPRDFSKCFLCTGFYYQQGEVLQTEIERFARVAAKCQSIRRDGAAALDMAFVAAGIFDAFWEIGLQPWDVAAGSLLVREAGGAVTNYQKNPADVYDVEGLGLVSGTPGAVREVGALLGPW